MRDVVILGSTGSIGTQALEVLASHPGRMRVRALAAGGNNLELLARQVKQYEPEFVAVAKGDARELQDLLGSRVRVGVGEAAVAQAAGMLGPEGVVLNGITGGIGLEPTLAALRSGAQLALANKESLVVGAPLVRAAMIRPGQVTPVDSEHSAIAQCLAAGKHEKGLTSPVVTGSSEVARLVLTASGGPFRGRTRAELTDVTAKQALAHPTWSMGPVVTINSSTLMNKGLELIEASVLFDVPAEKIDAVVHPQSIVHSMVTFKDGATIAQASPPDMKLPIALALSAPQRWADVEAPCTWGEPTSWTFEPVDNQTFPAVNLARSAVAASDTHPAVLNAANEVCVDAFLAGHLQYLEIVDTVARVLDEHTGVDGPTFEQIVQVQHWAVERARNLIADQ
ncbi:1-deoxy-D-xylulose-5-phosphate reductoisomerase [Gleimia hominis]|uniref:1-deoxy-D-xylulose 5-phosphate reductoisomerase n=1 Tax=Gleimia hominis TaxID=595468 RepID=A0ABU3IC02_9ACTO|nr:1-deoxy-D-xylulose-5-phosphate reductoisomerase [Gleimia hominis]MDT3767906.1 1-deoxy-D-xylulose-5-phosphate reductoisomerase [Gleimia hominis]